MTTTAIRPNLDGLLKAIEDRDTERDQAVLEELPRILMPLLPRMEFCEFRHVEIESVTTNQNELYRVTVSRETGRSPLVFDICKRTFWGNPHDVIALVVQEITHMLGA